jgi:hypothetical protein
VEAESGLVLQARAGGRAGRGSSPLRAQSFAKALKECLRLYLAQVMRLQDVLLGADATRPGTLVQLLVHVRRMRTQLRWLVQLCKCDEDSASDEPYPSVRMRQRLWGGVC